MTETNQPAPRRTPDPLSWILAVFLLANVVAVVCLILALGTARGRLHDLEQAVRLYEYERVPPPGYAEAFGFQALLRHLMYWAPQLQTADVARGDHDVIEAKVRGIVEGMAAQADNYPLIENAYLSRGALTKDPETSDEVRRWLLLAARGADSKKGTDLIVRTIRQDLPTGVPVGQRLRWRAADILLSGRDEDKFLAGEVLYEILTSERDGDAQFFQFVTRYQATGHPKVEQTMLMLLGRREHNRMTVQKAVEYLGRIKSKDAIDPVKTLFLTPPWRTGDNHLFRTNCLEALDKIMGSGIRPFLEEASRKEGNAFVRTRIDALRKKYSSGGNGGGRGR